VTRATPPHAPPGRAGENRADVEAIGRAASVDAEPPSTVPPSPVGIRFLGHATVVLDLPGLRIVTDPFLRDRLGPLRRHGPVPHAPAIGAVEVVLVSHAHPDHYDPRSLRLVPGDPLVIAPRGLGGRIRRLGLRAREVVVDEIVSLAPGWTVTAVPARHWRWPGAPTAATIGYLVEGPLRRGIYFAGDTSRFTGLRELGGRVDLALLPVGSWGPHRTPGHLTPRSAALVAREIGARVAVPIHWGTLYPRGLERIAGSRLTEPARRFASWAERLAPDVDVRVVEPGGATSIEG
jgi:L-ascorbate metabolism protein UlaG (beta-lactamase superfamily)